MKAAIIALNFGEPENATLEEVTPFLERIFMMNASLEDAQGYERARQRSKQLAAERVPGLIEEYHKIGKSPLHAQARAQADALRAELAQRGHDVQLYLGMQFTQPSIADAVASARAAGVERVVGLPIYPLCGPSTTVAALAELATAVSAAAWDIELREISGWHTHPLYTALRADAIRRVTDAHGLDLNDGRTKLVYSAHGTPRKYLDQGSRYEEYVIDSCRRVADALGVVDYVIGYQNHANRPGVEWTKPDIEDVVREVRVETIVVDGISFMHEQSETLAELDHDLRERAEARGLSYFRVPIPHDDPRLAVILADLVEPLIVDRSTEAGLRPCRCRERPGVYCLNR